MNLVSEYIKYLFNAQGRYGIHSPYVYDFVDKCLKIEPEKEDLLKIKELKKRLKKDLRKIEIYDAGVGSKKMGTVRTVKSIFETASSKGVYTNILYQIPNFYEIRQILELGTSLGVGTSALALGNKNANVVSVEACANTMRLAEENLNLMKINNVTLVNATFEDFLSENNIHFDLVYIDGHHDGESLKRYLKLLKQFSHDETIFLLDDIRWSDDMFQAWNQLTSDESYHLSMDLLRMGVLVPRKHQVKQHFVIKLKNSLFGF
jgi:predicted O-methyltransferase YrrM